MWFPRKNKAFQSPPTPPSTPTSHRRTIPATPPVAEWIGQDADWLDASADNDDAWAEAYMQRAARKRALAAAYRPLTAAPQPQPAPVAPQITAEPDLSQHNPTWQLPQEPGMCGCKHYRGESCELCDALVSEGISILTPWSPSADGGDTAAYPEMANGGWLR